MTEQKLKTNMTQDQLDQIAELVTFIVDEDGKLYIHDVCGDVCGDVYGNVEGSVLGNVCGDVLGIVRGSVGDDVCVLGG
jgi:hypothetical protein